MSKTTLIGPDGDILDPFRSFISKSRYSRWIPEFNRRETWAETVNRYVDFISPKVDLTPDEKYHLRYNILNHNVMPSMRLLMTAGEAAERSNLSAYNCSHISVNSLRVFDEALFVLMNGTGLGFSVSRTDVEQLPVIPSKMKLSSEPIVVHDSKEGWAQSYRELIASLYRGELPSWDLRQLRPEGARLRTFGGRSSGPAPLNELFEFTVRIMAAAAGRKLSTLECHEIMCKIGSVVVVGGVRRAALISLSDLDDYEIRDAKSGEWWKDREHLALANNSVKYLKKPTREVFDAEWKALELSGSGERGIFNLAGGRKSSPARRDKKAIVATNPCGEILLRDAGVCNLTEIIVRHDDTIEDLEAKIALASKIGTWQASLTNFSYVRDIWRHNAEEEALLGVSMTGVMEHPVLNGSAGTEKQIEWLRRLKRTAVSINRREAKRIGINQATAVTTNKPAGTTSTLTNTASGIHPWHDKFFIRRVRMAKSDPLSLFFIDAGLDAETDFYNERSWVFSFPFKAPEGSVTRNDRTAIHQLENWLIYKTHWTEHNPSVTINVKNEEWAEVGDWVFEHFDEITGVSFLPYSDHTYTQAPFETVDEATYEEMLRKMPEHIDWSLLPLYEHEDTTTNAQQLACVSGVCSIDDMIPQPA